MTDKIKERLEEINDVSRQLLSRILAKHTDSKTPAKMQEIAPEKMQPIIEENDELAQLTKERQVLITQLFEQNSAEKISSQTMLLQDMISLDSKLTASSQLYKQAITEQVIKIKKSKKMAKSYQKY